MKSGEACFTFGDRRVRVYIPEGGSVAEWYAGPRLGWCVDDDEEDTCPESKAASEMADLFLAAWRALIPCR